MKANWFLVMFAHLFYAFTILTILNIEYEESEDNGENWGILSFLIVGSYFIHNEKYRTKD